MIARISINASTEVLTAVGGSPFAAGTFMRQLALVPAENFLYVPSRSDSNFHAYSVASGVLAPIGGSPVASAGQLMSAAVSPDGGYLYTGRQTANNIIGYSLNAGTGAPTALAFAPTAVAFPQTLSFEPGGKYLFSFRGGATNGVDVFNFNAATGELNQTTGSPYTFGSGAHQVVFLTETISQ